MAGQEGGTLHMLVQIPNPPSHHPTAEQSHKFFIFPYLKSLSGERWTEETVLIWPDETTWKDLKQNLTALFGFVPARCTQPIM